MKNILVAYDGGQPAHRALETGIELAQRFDASLAVVSVVPVHPGRAPFDPWDDKSVHDEQLAEARDILARHGVAAEFIEPSGDPARAIERVAADGSLRHDRRRVTRTWRRRAVPAWQRVRAFGNPRQSHGGESPVSGASAVICRAPGGQAASGRLLRTSTSTSIVPPADAPYVIG